MSNKVDFDSELPCTVERKNLGKKHSIGLSCEHIVIDFRISLVREVNLTITASYTKCDEV